MTTLICSRLSQSSARRSAARLTPDGTLLRLSVARRTPHVHGSSPAGRSWEAKGIPVLASLSVICLRGTAGESPPGAWRADDSQLATQATGPGPDGQDRRILHRCPFGTSDGLRRR